MARFFAFAAARCSARFASFSAAGAGHPSYLFLAQSPELLAVPLAHLGRADDALRALERAAAVRSPFLIGFKVHPMLEPIREHPRFQRVVSELGLD